MADQRTRIDPPVLSTSLWAYCFSWLTLKEVSRLRLTSSKWHLAAGVCETTYPLQDAMLWVYHPSMPDCLSFYARYVPTVRSLTFDMKEDFVPDAKALKRARHVRSVTFHGQHVARVCDSVLMALPGPLLELSVESHVPSTECWDEHRSTLTHLTLYGTVHVPVLHSFAALRTLRLGRYDGKIDCAVNCMIQQLDELTIWLRGDWNDEQVDPLRVQLFERQADASRPFQLGINKNVLVAGGPMDALELNTGHKYIAIIDADTDAVIEGRAEADEKRVRWAAWIHRDVAWKRVHVVSSRRSLTKSLLQLSYLGWKGVRLQIDCVDFDDDDDRLFHMAAHELANWSGAFLKGQVDELVLSANTQNMDSVAILHRFPGLARIACHCDEEPKWHLQEDVKEKSATYAAFFEPWREQRLVQRVYFPNGRRATFEYASRVCSAVTQWCD